MTLEEQHAAIQQLQVTDKILSDVKRSYLNNMDSLASAVAQEVNDEWNESGGGEMMDQATVIRIAAAMGLM